MGNKVGGAPAPKVAQANSVGPSAGGAQDAAKLEEFKAKLEEMLEALKSQQAAPTQGA